MCQPWFLISWLCQRRHWNTYLALCTHNKKNNKNGCPRDLSHLPGCGSVHVTAECSRSSSAQSIRKQGTCIYNTHAASVRYTAVMIMRAIEWGSFFENESAIAPWVYGEIKEKGNKKFPSQPSTGGWSGTSTITWLEKAAILLSGSPVSGPIWSPLGILGASNWSYFLSKKERKSQPQKKKESTCCNM